jgi:hypothetical protein
MNSNYKSEIYRPWLSINLVKLERKLVNETAFDGIVKIYALRCHDQKINELLEDKYFGDFIHPSNTGIFLRMFISKNSWPITKLIYIDFETASFKELQKTNSSWNVWTGTDLGNDKHSIEISPSEKINVQISEVL